MSLAWNPNPEPDVIGYRVYYGPAGGTPTFSKDAGGSTTTTVTGLQEGASYSFHATAYNSAGLESELSSPVSYTIPSTVNNLPVTWEKSFSPNAANYNFFYGPPDQTPTLRNVGTNLSTVVSNVIRGGTYEVTVEAINSAGSPVTDYEIVTYTIPQTGTIGSIHLLAVDYPPTIALTS
ncbi:MAG: fibronectin type III domain-containing protein, partial [Limisphaerales bacterium]